MPKAQLQKDTFMDQADIDYKYCLLPRRCYKTRRQLWLKEAVRARRTYVNSYTGSGKADYTVTVVEDRWYDLTEFLIMRIKGNY
jgi:hypothetical protein